MKKLIIPLLILFASAAHPSFGNDRNDAYIFTSFHEPSTDGMRYLYSYDGLQWDSIPGVFMRPEIGNTEAFIDAFTGESVIPTFAPDERVLRDPSITQGPDERSTSCGQPNGVAAADSAMHTPKTLSIGQSRLRFL